MTAEPGTTPAARQDGHGGLLLPAVLDDVRETLRMPWLDPGIEVAASSPVFFAAAWSAIRPSIGRNLLSLARALRDQASGSVTAWPGRRDLSTRLRPTFDDGDLQRIRDVARAAHLAGAKVQIVLHLVVRAGRRERVRGTGVEEPPARRGIPEWQRWMSVQPMPDPARPLLTVATDRLGAPESPSSLRLLARWPEALEALWLELEPWVHSDEWSASARSLRRTLLLGLDAVPHPVELQWTALRERGFDEDEREALVAALEDHDGAAAGETLTAAFAWRALGAPELGPEA